MSALHDERFEALLEALEAEGHDQTIPGADRDGRFALLTEVEGSPTLTRARSRLAAQTLAATMIEDALGWPRAIFNLDELEGDPPPADVGDIVTLDGGDERWHVVHATDDLAEGMVFWKFWLARSADVDFDEADHIEVHQERVEIVKREEPDERLPVRYECAGVQTVVLFDKTAARP